MEWCVRACVCVCTVLFYGVCFQQDLVVTADEDIAQRVAQRERVFSGKKVSRCLSTMSAAIRTKMGLNVYIRTYIVCIIV